MGPLENGRDAAQDHGVERSTFRQFTSSKYVDRCLVHYRGMRTSQSLAFVKRMNEKYTFADGAFRAKLTVREALNELSAYVDSSDPDLGLPNAVHALQTAEGARLGGQPDWFQLVALVHDLGKIMYLWGTPEDGQVGTAEGPQWALGGDTWVVGCRIPDVVVYPELNDLNPDMSDPVLSTELGIYESGCGLDNLLFAYGHDEYMYQMLKANGCTVPPAGLAMVRYHSCYPLHTGGAYRELLAPGDAKTLDWVRKFNEFDLYTKDEGAAPDIDALWPHYQKLIDKFLPGDAADGGRLRW